MTRGYAVVVVGASALVAALAPRPVAAQRVEPGTAEVAGFAGGVLKGGGALAYGGSFGAAATRRLLVGVEFSHASLGSHTFDEPMAPSLVVRDSSLWDINANAHLLFPVPGPKAAPYLAAGGGLLRNSFTLSNERWGQIYTAEHSRKYAAFNFGGGLRLYLTERLGVRPEVRVFAGTITLVRVSIGLFHQSGP